LGWPPGGITPDRRPLGGGQPAVAGAAGPGRRLPAAARAPAAENPIMNRYHADDRTCQKGA